MKSRRWKREHNPNYKHFAIKRNMNGVFVKVGDMTVHKDHVDYLRRINVLR